MDAYDGGVWVVYLATLAATATNSQVYVCMYLTTLATNSQECMYVGMYVCRYVSMYIPENACCCGYKTHRYVCMSVCT